MEKGYLIKVFNLVDFDRSDAYDPFAYIRDDKDVLKLITNLIKNSTPKGSKSSDPFWEKAETALLEALMFYLLYEAPKAEQNFGMIMKMLSYADVKEDRDDYVSPLDLRYPEGGLEGSVRDGRGHLRRRAFRMGTLPHPGRKDV